MYRVYWRFISLKDGVEEQYNKEFKCVVNAYWFYIMGIIGLTDLIEESNIPASHIIRLLSDFHISIAKVK